MTYHVLVQFDVPSDKREAFAAAGLFDANGSLQNEPGTLRFEVIRDENNRNRFYLDEVYEDEAAFLQHCRNETIARFYELIDSYASVRFSCSRATASRVDPRSGGSPPDSTENFHANPAQHAPRGRSRGRAGVLHPRPGHAPAAAPGLSRGRFTLAFVGYQDERAAAALELTHNWDRDGYTQGDGYGHLAIEVEDAAVTCARARALGYRVTREAGPMQHGRSVIAFLEDPDGYKVELIQKGTQFD